VGHGGGQDGKEAEPEEARPAGAWVRRAARGEIADDGHIQVLFKCVAGADDPQGGDGEREPEPISAGGIGHTGVLPLPPAALDHFESAFDPGADTIPRSRTVRGGEVGQDEPGVLIAGLPTGDERAVEATFSRDKGGPTATPGGAGLGHEVAQPDPLRASVGTEFGGGVDAQEGMPAHADDTAEQPARVEAAIRQHDDGPVRRDGGPQQADEAQPLAAPGPLFLGGEHFPGHGDSTAPIDHADG